MPSGCINPQTIMLGQEPRQTTSNLGHLHKPSIQVRCMHFESSLLLFHQKGNVSNALQNV